jgi:anti-sigma B factor antagonist
MSAAGPFQITDSDDARGPLLRIRGEIDMNNSPALRLHLAKLLDLKPRRVVLDLSAASYVDSSGIGTLVEFKRKLDRVRGQLVLAALTPRVRGVLEITKLDSFFALTATVEEAMTQ